MTRIEKLQKVFQGAHAEGRAVMGELEFQLVASVEGLSRVDISRALLAGEIRKGLTGYWLREAPDPGALAVMRAAIREASSEPLPGPGRIRCTNTLFARA